MTALEGIRILDLSRLLPGPYATQMLADLGAEVIKIEQPPDGDYLRLTPPLIEPDQDPEFVVSAVFAHLNRDKKSVCIDFGSPRGREVLMRLAQNADVLVESFRPGALARRGLGYQDFRAVNPRFIYCSLSGYGQNGPYRQRAGHDIDYLALAGILNLNARRNAVPAPPPVQIADLSGGMLATVQILAALVERTHTGQGKYLDVALFDAAVKWMQTVVGSSYGAVKTDPERGQMPLTGAFPCYNVYETLDGGSMALGALEPNFWKGFCEALGRADLIDAQLDPDAIETLAAIFRRRTRAEWIEFGKHVDVCLEPLLQVSEALAHPQLQARGLAAPDLRRVPRLGQDTLSILKQAGYDDAGLEALCAAGTIAAA